MKKIILFIMIISFVFVSFCLAQTSSTFPQDKIDRVILNHWYNCSKFTRIEEKRNINKNESSFSFGDTAILQDRKKFEKDNQRETLYIGPGTDTLFIYSDYEQDGNIFIIGEGTLLVDNAQLTISGHLYMQDQGQAIFRNNAHLFFNQYYYHQYLLYLTDQSHFEITDAIFDCNGIMHSTYLYDDATFIAQRTEFPVWSVKKIEDNCGMILEDINCAGQFRIRDSCSVHLTRCNSIMSEFQAPDGSDITITFPNGYWVDHFEFSDSAAGVNGIDYEFVADSCAFCTWAIETFPACSVIVNDSQLCGSTIRMTGTGTASVEGIKQDTLYSNFRIPVYDRYFQLVNTHINYWWWFPMDNTILYVDSCEFAQITGSGNSEAYVTGSHHGGGQGEALMGAAENSFVSFIDGFSSYYVYTLDMGTFLIVDSEIITQCPWQEVNIATNQSNLLCVNSYLDPLPIAADAALVMFAAIDSPSTVMTGETVDIFGSAWIEPGPENPVAFEQYKLYWSVAGSFIWTQIEESANQVDEGILAEWNTSGLEEGDYDLMLTIFDSIGDSLIALRTLTLIENSEVEEEIISNRIELLGNYPNPFNPTTTISFELNTVNTEDTELIIYNLKGQKVKTFSNLQINNSTNQQIVWDARDENSQPVSSGIYFFRLKSGKEFSETKRMLFLK